MTGPIDFQSLASEQGMNFETTVAVLLQTCGWTVVAQRRRDETTSEEIDFVVETPDGETLWIECKGSYNPTSRRNGLIRSDTAKKAVAVAWHLHYAHGNSMPPYVLVGSHMPSPDSEPGKLLRAAQEAGLFESVVHIGDLVSWINERGT